MICNKSKNFYISIFPKFWTSVVVNTLFNYHTVFLFSFFPKVVSFAI